MTTNLDETPDQATTDARLRTGRPWRRLFLALAVLLLTILAAAWLQRRTIAREFVDRELSRRGVRAHYQIEQLSPWRQRLTGVVLGDPRDPDLTADWVEIGTAFSPWRANLLALRAGHVRLNARIVAGKLALGDLDRLLPPPSGKPFALPHVRIDVADARIRLDSGHGVADIAVAGRGMLDDGFAGTARVAAPRLDIADCAAEGVTGAFDLRIRKARPELRGPLAASQVQCAGVRAIAPKLNLGATFGAGLDSWQGTSEIAARALDADGRRLSDLSGSISFDGTARGTRGTFALRSGRFAAPEAAGASLQLAGDYRQQTGRIDMRGKLVAGSAALPRASRARIGEAAASADGTPVAPIALRLAQAATAAAAQFDAAADFALASGPAGTTYAVPRLSIAAASGARLSFDRGLGVTGRGAAAPAIDGTLAVRGGGMPEAVLRLSQAPGDNRIRGTGFVQRYAAGDAALALSRIVFALGSDGGELRTVATLSGPIGTGRVDDLSLPLDARWRGGQLTLNPACTAIRYERIRLAGATFAPARLTACPIGSAMLGWSPHGVRGGVRLVAPELAGAIGASPLLLGAAEARLDLASRRFTLAGLRVRLGADRVTRLDADTLTGSFAGTPAGDFGGLGGQFGAVPLVVSGAAGRWEMRDDGLAIAGGLRLTDAATPARFHPLASQDARLRLVGNTLTATAGLATPAGLPVARVSLQHDLAKGAGDAAIDVRDLRFAEGGLQPSDLTPLTFGVIADVSGTVEGSGRIAWTPEGVISTGRFGTTSMDLAAAFGPVRGLATTLDFTDLLNMRTAPGQAARVAEINPGVPVRDGAIRFRLLDAQRVQVEGARWPFAGGELVLEPTLLDFSESRERRMTFRVVGVDAALFLKEMEFDNLDATGTFDGTLPMIFDAKGGRIEGGALRARAGGSLAYVGELSQRDLGFWGDMAFQALKALDYKSLTIAMNGPLAGDMVTEIRFSGVSQGKGTKSNFLLRRLAKLPFVFNVRVSAPFKQLLDSVQSWYDPNRLIERNLPSLLEQQDQSDGGSGATPVQPPESEKLR